MKPSSRQVVSCAITVISGKADGEMDGENCHDHDHMEDDEVLATLVMVPSEMTMEIRMIMAMTVVMMDTAIRIALMKDPGTGQHCSRL